MAGWLAGWETVPRPVGGVHPLLIVAEIDVVPLAVIQPRHEAGKNLREEKTSGRPPIKTVNSENHKLELRHRQRKNNGKYKMGVLFGLCVIKHFRGK